MVITRTMVAIIIIISIIIAAIITSTIIKIMIIITIIIRGASRARSSAPHRLRWLSARREPSDSQGVLPACGGLQRACGSKDPGPKPGGAAE